MIKMYVMHTCPDCEYVEKQVVGNPLTSSLTKYVFYNWLINNILYLCVT